MLVGIKQKTILFFALLCSALNFYSQSKIDSLFNLLKADKEDTVKLTHLNKLSMEYFASRGFDSIEHYSFVAIKLAEKLAGSEDKSFARAATKQLLKANVFLGIVNFQSGNYNLAHEYFQIGLKFAKQLNNKAAMANTCANIGLVYYSQGNYPKALDNYLEALRLVEELKDKSGMARFLLNISGVYYEQGDLEKSLDYDLKVLNLAEEIGNIELKGTTYGNIGIIYSKQNKHGKALEHYYKALKIAEEIKDGVNLSACYGNIGQAYQAQGDSAIAAGNKDYAFSFKYPKSKECFLLSLKTAKESGNINQIPTALAHLGLHYMMTKEYKEVPKYLHEALILSDSIGALNLVKNAYANLSTMYEKSPIPLPDSTLTKTLSLEQMRLRSIYYYKKYVALNDSIFSQESKKQMLQKHMNFDFERKQNVAKAEQDKKDIIVEEEKLAQKIIMGGVSLGLVLVIILASVIFKSLRQNQQKNKIITEQKKLVEHQKELVEEKQNEILDSIVYARRIQTALIPSEKYFDKTLNRLNEQ